MIISYEPKEFDPRLDDDGNPIVVKGVDGKDVTVKGPFLPDLFKGTIQIKVPSYPERLRFPKQLGVLDLNENAEDSKEKLKEGLKKIEMVAKCSEMIIPYIEKVDLEYSHNGKTQKLESVDDLYSFPEAEPFVTGLCTKFLTSFVTKKT